MKENEWKPIKGYPLYEVSTNGEIASIERFVHGKHGLVKRKRRILKQFLRSGYPSVDLFSGPKISRSELVHRIIAIAFISNPDNKPQINHKNGIRHDNRIENLEWCTSFENQQHATHVLGRVSVIEATRKKDPELKEFSKSMKAAYEKKKLKKHGLEKV